MADLSSMSTEELEKLYATKRNAEKKDSLKIGFQKKIKKETYLSQLSDDELQNLYNSYKSAGSDQLSNQEPQEVHPALNAIKDFLKGAAQENIDLGTGLYNLGARGATALLRSQGLNFPTPKPVNFNIMDNVTHPTAARLGRVAGILGTAFTPASAAARLPLIGKGIGGLLELAQLKPIANVSRGTLSALERKNLNNWLTRTLLNAGEGAASGATYGAALGANKENVNLKDEAIKSALLGSALGAALPQLGEIGPALKNKKINALIKEATSGASNMKTPAEAAKDLNIAENLPIDLGSFTGNADLAKKFEVSYGRTKAGKESAVTSLAELRKQATDFVKNLGNKYYHDSSQLIPDLQEHLQNQLEKHQQSVSDNFQDVMKEAKNRGIFSNENPRFQKISKEILKNSLELSKEGRTEILSDGAELREILKRGSKTYIKKSAFGNLRPDEIEMLKKKGIVLIDKDRSLWGLDEERKALGRLADKYAANKKMYLASLAAKAEAAIQEDIERILQKNNHQDLLKKWKEGRDIFANKVVPYRDKRLRNLVESQTNPELLPGTLLNAQYDMIFKELPEELRKGILYRHLNRENLSDVDSNLIESINPTALLRNYKILSKSQNKNRIFKPEELETLNNLTKLNSMLETAKNIEKPPRTGFYGALENDNLGEKVKKYGPLVAALLAGHALPLGEIGGGLASGVVATLIKNSVKQKSAKFLTSPEAKRAFAKQEKFKPTNKSASIKNRGIERLINEYLTREQN